MRSLHEDNEHKPRMKEKCIPCYADFPAGEFSPLVKECFERTLNLNNLDSFVFDKVFPIYHQFLHMINQGYAVIAKNSGEEKSPPLLESISSLKPTREYLERSSEEHLPMQLKIYPQPFEVLLNLSYPEKEIINFRKKGVKNRYLLEGIFDFATAYSYWCLSNIIEGKRIGVVEYCKNGEPNINGDFYEFDMMQRFFPSYNRMKAFSFSERDFLINASRKEIGDRLVDILSDFGQEVKKKNNSFVLARMTKQIKEYGKRLEWNPAEFFKNIEER
jgi:hypothetical protein